MLVSVEPLKQALTNAVFLLTFVNNKKVIFKRLNLKARDADDRKCELRVHQLASEFGFTPKVLAWDERCKLQEYFPGEMLSRSPINTDIIKLLALQLKKIHRFPALHARPQRLAFTLNQLKKSIEASLDEEQFSIILNVAIELDNSSPKNVLCHGDLSLHNLLINSTQQIMILDWEYATLACAAYDLASSVCINELNSLQQKVLLAEYYHLNKDNLPMSLSALQKECGLYLSVFTYLNQLWVDCSLADNK